MGTETKLLVFDREDMGIEIREPLAQQFPRHWRGAFSTYRWITSMRHSTKTAYQFQYLCAFQRPRCRTLLHDARFSIEGRRPIYPFAPSHIAIIDGLEGVIEAGSISAHCLASKLCKYIRVHQLTLLIKGNILAQCLPFTNTNYSCARR